MSETTSESCKDLAVAGLAWIEMHPEGWDQTHWRCGSGGCLAGHMVIMSESATWLDKKPDSDNPVVEDRGEFYVDPQEWAVDALGMDPDDAEALFNYRNDLDDLRVGIQALLDGRDVFQAITRGR